MKFYDFLLQVIIFWSDCTIDLLSMFNYKAEESITAAPPRRTHGQSILSAAFNGKIKLGIFFFFLMKCVKQVTNMNDYWLGVFIFCFWMVLLLNIQFIYYFLAYPCCCWAIFAIIWANFYCCYLNFCFCWFKGLKIMFGFLFLLV